jgi:hypothetical protein
MHLNRKTRSGVLTGLLAAALIAYPVSASAEGSDTAAKPAPELIPGGEEQFKVTFGGMIAQIGSSIGINGATNVGTEIDLGANSGKKANSFILGGEWRIGSRHRVTGLYFSTKKDRSLSFNQSIIIGDDTLLPPTALGAVSRNRFVLGTYQYSFLKNKDIELAGVLGAYVNKFSADISGTAKVQNVVNGTTTIVTRSVAYSPGFTVPMPTIGASIDWFISPRFTLGASLSGLKAKIGDINGGIFVGSAKAEYMFTRNIGAGLSYMHADLDVKVTKPSFTGNVKWKNDNFLAYVLLKI